MALAAILAGSSFLPLGGSVLGSWAAFGWWRWMYNLTGTGKFVQVAPDVYRCACKVDLAFLEAPVGEVRV